MAITKIKDDFVFVGTHRELVSLMGSLDRDRVIGDDSTVMLVDENATQEQREQMAARAAEIVKARNQ